MIYGNAVMAPAALKTVILTDNNGNEFIGTVVGEQTVFDATTNDVREGKVFASNEGVQTGTKNIPAYHTTAAVELIPIGSALNINLSSMDKYNYTKLQVIICKYSTSLSASVVAEKVVINDKVYNVGESTSISTVVKNDADKTIMLGITNSGTEPVVLRYFTYKEID